jgi:hypothetical protein
MTIVYRLIINVQYFTVCPRNASLARARPGLVMSLFRAKCGKRVRSPPFWLQRLRGGSS